MTAGNMQTITLFINNFISIPSNIEKYVIQKLQMMKKKDNIKAKKSDVAKAK